MNTFFRLPNIASAVDRAMVHPELKKLLTREEFRQRLFSQVSIIVGLPILLFFGVNDLIYENGIRDAFPELSVAVTLVVTALIVRKRRSVQILLRVPMAAVSMLLLYNIYTAPGKDAVLLWMTSFPLFAFAIFGRKEGAIWSISVVSISIAMVQFPSFFGAHEYISKVGYRYAIAISLVTALSYAGEFMRHSFYHEIQNKNKQIEAAMHDIKTLRGLLPICSHCKKIRDDNGYWRNLESYISQHTDARFSHGICISCLRRMDPALYREMLAEGQIRESQDPPPLRVKNTGR